MKKYFLCLAFFASTASLNTKAVDGVLIDAGHSLKNPGSFSYSGHQESFYTAMMQKKVTEALQRQGIKSRAIDQNKTLLERAQTSGDLLVSLHYDSVPSSLRKKHVGDTVFGYSVFVSAKNTDYKKSVSCARSVAWGLQHAGEKPSLFHQKGLGGKDPRPLVDEKLGVHRFDDLILLKKSKQAAILVELGMWINKYDEKRLLSEKTTQMQAEGIALGIKQCLFQTP